MSLLDMFPTPDAAGNFADGAACRRSEAVRAISAALCGLPWAAAVGASDEMSIQVDFTAEALERQELFHLAEACGRPERAP